MSPQLIVVGSILQPAQVSFTQDDHVIDALAPDRADQPFSKPILPGRSRNRLVTNPHGRDVRKRKVQKDFHEQEGRNGIDETATNDCAAGRN